ncbi:MAG: hypothetical protein B5M56_07475 [Desulfococcus sp. 4484_241]|nr:MAG: hypothetical protein B5M56_07475 [Desulfococcus sp. 4484_241]
MTKKQSEKQQKKQTVVKKRGLGRGLDALFPEITAQDGGSDDYIMCDIDLIHPNRFQPRASFDPRELESLAQSIKKDGIIQPVVVRKSDGGFELVAGERRLRAARLAGLSRIPALVREISDTQHLVYSIVENVQRENLNPLEEAQGYYMLIKEFGFSQEDVAQAVGKSRSAVANILRLRNLPEHIKESIADGAISMGHARALLAARTPQQQNSLWQAILSKGLSVRQTEELVKQDGAQTKEKAAKKDKKKNSSNDAYFSDVESNLARALGTRVRIRRTGKRGKIEIEFYSNDDLDRLLDLLNRI